MLMCPKHVSLILEFTTAHRTPPLEGLNVFQTELKRSFYSFIPEIFFPLPKDIFFISFRKRGREGEKNHPHESEAPISCFLYAPSPGIIDARTGDQTHNLGMYPDRELNPQPFCYGRMLLLTEPHWPGSHKYLLSAYSVSSTISLGLQQWMKHTQIPDHMEDSLLGKTDNKQD